MDIRNLPLASQLPPYLQADLPTIFISECCLVYMDIENASSLLKWACQTFQEAGVGVILYEQIGGHDAFGRMMVRNLAVMISSRYRLTRNRLGASI
jgi:[phosphatase 2A protein]-leucine-carboxy methyltransferase